MRNAEGAGDYTCDFADVARAEHAWLAERRAASGLPPPSDDHVGLAFSGGGIRSGTFNLGVLQALQAAGLLRHVDYLSSVSGGGYAACGYHWLRATAPEAAADPYAAPSVSGRGTVLDWIRAHGKFLIAQKGYSMRTLFASILASTLMNVVVLGPPLLLAIWALTLAWLPNLGVAQDLGYTMPERHHGFVVLLVLGFACLALFVPIAISFALLTGVPRLARAVQLDHWRVGMGRLITAGVVLLVVGSIPVATYASEALMRNFESKFAEQIGHHVPYLLSLLSGGAAMAAGENGKKPNPQLAMAGLVLLVYGLLLACYHLAVHVGWIASPGFFALAALSLFLACVCNVNGISMHAYYRARLATSFLPVVKGSRRDDVFSLPIHELEANTGAPLPLVNATLNTSCSPDPQRRARMGDCFTYNPLYSGSTATGWRRTAQYARGISALSAAMTTSGAAIDPDTINTRSRAMSFLMALLNVRLGYWGENPAHTTMSRLPLPWWWILLGREALGFGLDETRARVHLSDGGGFENLGAYELIRRRLRFIVISDAGWDPQRTLSDLGGLIEKVRVDFGARIELTADAYERERRDAFVATPSLLGRVTYADGSQGRILYLRPLLVNGLGADIYAYWRAHPDFPDEPTSQQFYGEAQFEAYRMLGLQLTSQLVGATPPASVAAWFDAREAAASG